MKDLNKTYNNWLKRQQCRHLIDTRSSMSVISTCTLNFSVCWPDEAADRRPNQTRPASMNEHLCEHVVVVTEMTSISDQIIGNSGHILSKLIKNYVQSQKCVLHLETQTRIRNLWK